MTSPRAVKSRSHPESNYCGTREAAQLAFLGYEKLLRWRREYPEHFTPDVVNTEPGSHELVWDKQKTIAAVNAIRTGKARMEVEAS